MCFVLFFKSLFSQFVLHTPSLGACPSPVWSILALSFPVVSFKTWVKIQHKEAYSTSITPSSLQTFNTPAYIMISCAWWWCVIALLSQGCELSQIYLLHEVQKVNFSSFTCHQPPLPKHTHT